MERFNEKDEEAIAARKAVEFKVSQLCPNLSGKFYALRIRDGEKVIQTFKRDIDPANKSMCIWFEESEPYNPNDKSHRVISEEIRAYFLLDG